MKFYLILLLIMTMYKFSSSQSPKEPVPKFPPQNKGVIQKMKRPGKILSVFDLNDIVRKKGFFYAKINTGKYQVLNGKVIIYSQCNSN